MRQFTLNNVSVIILAFERFLKVYINTPLPKEDTFTYHILLSFKNFMILTDAGRVLLLTVENEVIDFDFVANKTIS